MGIHSLISKNNLLNKKTIIWSGTFAFVTFSAYMAYSLYHKYETRFLREAEARIVIDDRQGAASALRSHLLEHPDDSYAQYTLAKIMMDLENVESSIRIFQQIIDNSRLEPKRRLLYDLAVIQLGDLIERECDNLEIKVKALFDENKFDSVSFISDSAISISKKSPYLNVSNLIADSASFSHFQTNYALSSYNRFLAYKAFSDWMRNSNQSPQSTIGSAADIPLFENYFRPQPYWYVSTKKDKKYDGIKQRQIVLSEIAYGKSMILFERKEWELSFRAFELAMDYYLLLNNGNYDENVANSHYNMAMCKFNDGKYQQSQSLLKDLEIKYPSYKSQITEAKKWASEQTIKNKADEIMKKAFNEFESKNWELAIGRFQEAESFLLENGFSEKDGSVTICKYNIAIAHSNNGYYFRALEMLENIKLTNPSFDTVLINANIEKIKTAAKIID